MAFTAILDSEKLHNANRTQCCTYWANLAKQLGAEFTGGAASQGHFKFPNKAAFTAAKLKHQGGVDGLTFITLAERRKAVVEASARQRPIIEAKNAQRKAMLEQWAAANQIPGVCDAQGPYGVITTTLSADDAKARLIEAGFKVEGDRYPYQGNGFHVGVEVFQGLTRLGIVFTA